MIKIDHACIHRMATSIHSLLGHILDTPPPSVCLQLLNPLMLLLLIAGGLTFLVSIIEQL